MDDIEIQIALGLKRRCCNEECDNIIDVKEISKYSILNGRMCRPCVSKRLKGLVCEDVIRKERNEKEIK